MGDLSPHFNTSEFFANDVEQITPDKALIDPRIPQVLEDIRAEIGNQPLTITSGYRSPDHPIEKAKKRPGEHTRGAVDFKLPPGVDPQKVAAYLESRPDLQVGGIGFYPEDGHFHIDLRGTKARWGRVKGPDGKMRDTTLEEALQFVPVPPVDVSTGEILQASTQARNELQVDQEQGVVGPDSPEPIMSFWDMIFYPGRRTRGELAQTMGRLGLTRSGLTEEDIPDQIDGDEFLKAVFDFDPAEFAQEGTEQLVFRPDPDENIIVEGLKFIAKFPGGLLKFEKAAQAQFLADSLDPLTLVGVGILNRTRAFLGGRKFTKEIEQAKRLSEKFQREQEGLSVESTGDRYRQALEGIKGPDEEVNRRANKLLNDDPLFFDKIRRLHGNRPLSDEEIVAAGMIAAEKGEAMMSWIGKLGPEAFHDKGLQKQLIEKLEDLAAWQAPTEKGISSVGRALEVTQEELTRQRRTFVKQFTDLFGKGIVDPVTAVKQISHFESTADLAMFAKQLSRPGWGQMYNELLINGLLSGPTTLMGLNPVGNTLSYMQHLGSRQLAGLFGSGAVPPGEAGRMAMASLQAVPAAFGVFWKTMRSGKHVLNEQVRGKEMKIDLQKFAAITAENFPDAPQWMIPGINWLGAALRLPSRTMMAQDEFLKSIFYQGELTAQAGRVAAQQPGFETLSRTAQAIRRKEILKEMVATPSKFTKAHRAARHTALENTFTAPLGEGGEAMVKVVNSSPFLKVLFPFVRTPVNIMKRIGNDLSFGMSPKLRAALRSKDPAIRDEAIGRISAASLMATTMIGLTYNGVIAGGRGPRDPQMRKGQAEFLGRQQGSIGFDSDGDGHADSFLHFNTRTPLGQFLNVMGSVGEGLAFIEEQGLAGMDDLAAEVVLALTDLMDEAPFMDGMANLFELQRAFERNGMQGVEEHIKRTAPTYLLPPFSSFRRQLAQAADPTKKTLGPLDQLETLMDGLANQIPGWSESVQPHHDMFGNVHDLPIGFGPASVQNNAFGRMALLFVPGLNMIKETAEIPKEELIIAQYMIDREYIPPDPRKRHRGVEIPHNLYEQWKQVAGTGVYTDADGKRLQLGPSMRDRLMEVIKEPDLTPVVQPDGRSIPEDLVVFKSEYTQQYQETLEFLLETPEWAGVQGEITNLENSPPAIERSTNILQRETIPLL